ncbi:hypothetical protein SAMN04487905_103368 [Actinopolyspora xinjiangensis]|uniref:Uncharacterized protein n=1 Tax=Actinopolyspora xinjiangensis TaxID=405564 RepID=A0A1H0S3Y4_9ACTN|nr:hypothetical protein [Actinopolyspora xinjiangensis]SDP36377.1 hypothetical protein SAMN04487905_103368 [Actinopolyspora xinjiangensis]
MQRYSPPNAQVKASSRTVWWFTAVCASLCGLTGLAAVVLPTLSYVSGGPVSLELPMSLLWKSIFFGILTYIFRLIHHKALRQEAERAKRAGTPAND